MSLIPAEHLKKIFSVEAKFYHVEIEGEKILMRREAHIRRNGISTTRADAVIVMINPSNCTQAGETFKSPQDAEWISTKPNPTQYQLMNLMERQEWNLITLINLSDICEGNMGNFKILENKFNRAGVPHSLFQEKNAKEREALLASANHLIFAWGSTNVAKRLAMEFGLFQKGRPEESYSHAKALVAAESGFPRHPKPATVADRVVWLQRMEDVLQ
ncbi:DUF1643 domain-containing protein [Planococcus maritimus]|nr:DUF1643 domain-containing protein [Planococcus sp. SK3692]MDE4084380.1 DUF1643 domain-containing protein [Planococcus maritimus]